MPNGVDYYTNANGDITVIGNIVGRKIIVTPEGVSDTPLHPNLEPSSNPDPVAPNANSNQSNKGKPSTLSVNAQAGRHVINIDKLETTGTIRLGGNNGGISLQGNTIKANKITVQGLKPTEIAATIGPGVSAGYRVSEGKGVVSIDGLNVTGHVTIGGKSGGINIIESSSEAAPSNNPKVEPSVQETANSIVPNNKPSVIVEPAKIPNSAILTRPEQTTRPGEIKLVTVEMTRESPKNEPQIHATYAQIDPKKWVWSYEVPKVNEEIKKYGLFFEDKHFSYNKDFIIQSAAEILENLGYAVHLQLESPKKTVKLPDDINYSFFFLDGDTDFDLGPCFCIVDKTTKQVYALDPIGYFNKSNVLNALDLQDFQLVFVTQKIEPKDTLSAGVYVAAVLVDLVRGNFQFRNPLKSMQELINFEEMTQNYQKHSATLLNSVCYAYSKVVEKRNKKKDQISETDSVKIATEKVAEGELAHPKKQQAKPVKLRNKKNKLEERTSEKGARTGNSVSNSTDRTQYSSQEYTPLISGTSQQQNDTNKSRPNQEHSSLEKMPTKGKEDSTVSDYQGKNLDNSKSKSDIDASLKVLPGVDQNQESSSVKILNNDSYPENPLKSPSASESEFKPTEELSDCSADNTNKPIIDTVNNINKAQEYTFKSIEGHLKMLNTKIGDKKQHHSDSAVREASALLKALDKNYEQYQNNIKGEMATNVADKKMLEACTEDINKAKKALENDLNWTSYLGNLLKAFANLFIKLINPNRLFAYTKPSSLQSIETCEDGIKTVLSQNL